MLSVQEVDNIMITYANETGAEENNTYYPKEKTPEPVVEEKPKKRGRKPKKSLKDVAKQVVESKPTLEKKVSKEIGTQTTIQEQYENTILSEEYEVRLRYLKKQMKKNRNNPTEFSKFSNAMEKLLNRKII